MNKSLIIAISVLLIISLTFGYLTINQSYRFVEDAFTIFSSASKTVLSVLGIDFGEKIDNFLPNLITTQTLGTYYDEEIQEVFNVRDKIISFLPSWIITRAKDPDSLTEIVIYPTLYSAEFNYRSTKLTIPGVGSFDGFNDSWLGTYKGISKSYCIRIEITIPDLGSVVSNRSYTYDVFIFYDNNELCYFVTYENNNIGIYSKLLTSYNFYVNEEDPAKKLNGRYELRLTDIQDSIIYKYQYSIVENFQSTGLHLSNSFDLFMKGE